MFDIDAVNLPFWIVPNISSLVLTNEFNERHFIPVYEC